GDILVTEMTNPDMVVAMQKSSAIITDEGGQTCHAAIISREMGIPAVVGTGKATTTLQTGDKVTVDGFRGKVYSGETQAKKVEIKQIVQTKTKIKVMVDLPDFAERASKTGCKEVGLTRLEGIIAESGKHPLAFIKKPEEYEKIIYAGLSKIAEYFDEIWVRTSDIRSDEFQHLEGAKKEVEVNPMLGMHGIRASLKYPELLKAELIAASKINKKLGIMMPQVISVQEVQKVKRLLEELGIKNLKLGVMIETPAAVQIIDELCKENIKFISFGTNDLTQYTLAIDRGNTEIQDLYDEMHPAVLRQLVSVIEICKKYNVETSICGQAGSKEEMVEFLVKHGIDSISVNADRAYDISLQVSDLENKGFKAKQETTKEFKIEKKTEEKESKKKRFEATCSSCKKRTDVPFQPDGVRPVYCKDCYELARVEKMMNSGEKIEKKEEVKEEKVQDKEEETEEFPSTNIEIDVFSPQI
ncbi:MAG: PEP-utilizing enzyme, partial [Candidatus Pacearchaeota archaeon]|nr:PEP-utilizing enzyme [Candidatus Pacearchaeota archaeon]